MNTLALMLIWTLVAPASTTSQSGVAVTQTATIVPALVCEETKKKIVTGPRPSISVYSHPEARVYVTIECIPMN